MAKTEHLLVRDIVIKTMTKEGMDYLCLTDIARQKNAIDPNGVIANWMRNRNTVELLGLWENLHIGNERTFPNDWQEKRNRHAPGFA